MRKGLRGLTLALVVVQLLPGLAAAQENTVGAAQDTFVGPASTVLKVPTFGGNSETVYKVLVTGGAGLTVEASDCCLQGDVYRVIMRQTQPAFARLRGKVDQVGGSTCDLAQVVTFPVGTLEEWQKGKVKIKRVYAITGLADAYVRFESTGSVAVCRLRGAAPDHCGTDEPCP